MSVAPVLVIGCGGETMEAVLATIRKCGLRAVHCADLSEARTLMAQEDFGAVFCSDTLLAGNSGALIRTLRESGPAAPVIILSHFADWDAYLTAIGAGAFDFIACPPDPKETERILWAALQESSSMHRMAHASA